jgi:NADH:ubiquinone oxidoreductase subunit F (NADH-binding)
LYVSKEIKNGVAPSISISSLFIRAINKSNLKMRGRDGFEEDSKWSMGA